MNVLRSGIVTMLLLAAFSVQAACTWPAWEQFKRITSVRKGASSTPATRAKSPPLKGKVTACSLPWRLTTVQLSIIFSTGRRTISLRVL
ncbi:glycosyl hydrolase family 8 [Escherichia coli]|nr:glycosyl hydrolase family 8 [Escherichia coli]